MRLQTISNMGLWETGIGYDYRIVRERNSMSSEELIGSL